MEIYQHTSDKCRSPATMASTQGHGATARDFDGISLGCKAPRILPAGGPRAGALLPRKLDREKLRSWIVSRRRPEHQNRGVGSQETSTDRNEQAVELGHEERGAPARWGADPP